MRAKERIEPFLDKVNLLDLFNNIWKTGNKELNQILSEYILINKEALIKYWKKNQDLRFSQVLINRGVIPNIPGYWYYMEESEILEKQGYPPEEVNYWGVYFGKDMSPLENPYYAPLSTLNTEHLKAILNGGFVRNNTKYQEIIKKILKERNDTRS